MKFNVFVGIDVSKSTIDVWIRSLGLHMVFSNNSDGFQSMVEWVMDCLGPMAHEQILFGLEHTGLYSELLIDFLDSNNLSFTVIPGLELKKSLGIRRGKSDKADSKDIAEYLYEKKEKVKLFKKPSKNLERISKLSSYRERMVKERAAYKARLGEHLNIFPSEELEVYIRSHKDVIDCFDQQIEKIQVEIERLVSEDRELSRQYGLVKSIKGIGPQTAIMLIVLTKGFTAFQNARKFASYSGIAPFPNQSGTHMGRTRTSKLANKRIKSLLTMCAGVAIQYNTEMKVYYERRIKDGKNKMSTMNIIRNKLVARAFAVIERGTDYVDTLKYAA